MTTYNTSGVRTRREPSHDGAWIGPRAPELPVEPFEGGVRAVGGGEGGAVDGEAERQRRQRRRGSACEAEQRQRQGDPGDHQKFG